MTVITGRTYDANQKEWSVSNGRIEGDAKAVPR